MDTKKKFLKKYSTKVEDEGYSMALGFGLKDDNHTLEVQLQPLEGSPDPINDDLLDLIKNEILPDN